MNCPLPDTLTSIALGDPDAPACHHVTECPTCSARLAELRAALDRLSAAFPPDPGHAAGRQKLLAALAAEPRPVPSTFRRMVMDRRNWLVTAAAAALVAGFLVWGTSPTVALADALKPFREAKSFSCELVPLKDGKPVKEAEKMTFRIIWAAPGSLRGELTADGKPQITSVFPKGKPGAVIHHDDKTFRTTDGKPGQQEAAFLRMIDRLAAYRAGDQKPAGEDEVAGVKATRFDLTIRDTGADWVTWKYMVWVHPETKRPLRVYLVIQAGELGPEKMNMIRLEKFEWDVKTDGLFDTTPPAGYKSVEVTAVDAEDLTAARIVTGLKAYREATGSYPKTEPLDFGKAAVELSRVVKKPLPGEVLQGLTLVGSLQATSKDAVYRGKTVGPDDKGKVLFRFKQADGRFRVIYGDLRAETVSAERLKELEKE